MQSGVIISVRNKAPHSDLVTRTDTKDTALTLREGVRVLIRVCWLGLSRSPRMPSDDVEQATKPLQPQPFDGVSAGGKAEHETARRALCCRLTIP